MRDGTVAAGSEGFDGGAVRWHINPTPHRLNAPLNVGGMNCVVTRLMKITRYTYLQVVYITHTTHAHTPTDLYTVG